MVYTIRIICNTQYKLACSSINIFAPVAGEEFVKKHACIIQLIKLQVHSYI